MKIDVKAFYTQHRKTLCYLAILTGIFIACFCYIFDKKLDLNGDNAFYYMTAKSIASGKGYVAINNPSLPPTNTFPPGYPLAMAFVMLFTQSIVAMKILNGIFLLAASLFFFKFIDRITQNRKLAFIVCLLPFFNWWVMDFATMMMSEMLFMLLIAISLFALSRMDDEKAPWKEPYWYIILFCLAYSFHVRTAAISLCVGFLFYFLIIKKYRYLISTLVGYVILMLPWMIRNKIHGIGGSRYWKQMQQANPWRPEEGTISFSELLERCFDHWFSILNKAIPNGMFFSYEVDYMTDSSPKGWLIGFVFLAIMLLGIFKLPKYRWVILGIILATVGMLGPFNGGGESRYIVSILPLFFLVFIYGLFQLFSFLVAKLRINIQVNPLIFVVLILFMYPGMIELNKRAESRYLRAYKSYFDIAKTAQKNTPPNTIFCCRKPFLFYVFASRPTVGYKSSLDDKEVLKGLVDSKADYVILEQLGYSSTFRYLYPAIQKNPEFFKAVIRKKNPDTYLLKFDAKGCKKELESQNSNSTQ